MSEQSAETRNVELGLDYGVRPRVATLGDVEFPSMLARNLSAVGYGTAHRYRNVVVDAPLLSLFFESEQDARDLFERFRTWSRDAFYSNGVRFSFVEFDDSSFGLCVVQDELVLFERLLSSAIRDEVEPHIFAVGHIKRFPRISEGYRSFKAFAHGKPVVINAMSPSGELADCILMVKTLPYYDAVTVPENSIERALVERNGPPKPRSSFSDQSTRSFDPNDIRARRTHRLRRFFPVTLIRLRASMDFLNAEKRLMAEGYRSWQILQAACNLTLPARCLGLNDTGLQESHQESERLNAVGVLQRLLGSHEDVQLRPHSRLTDCDALRHQIELDSSHLVEVLSTKDAAKVSTSPQQWLAQHGLLDTGVGAGTYAKEPVLGKL